MRFLFVVMGLLLVSVPAQADQFFKLLDRGTQRWIVAAGAGLKAQLSDTRVVRYEGPKEPVPAHPDRVETAWRWNGGDPVEEATGTVLQPDPSLALDRTITYATQLTGSRRAAYEELTKQPGILISILADRYDDTKDLYDALVADGTLSDTQGGNFKGILDGTYTPSH